MLTQEFGHDPVQDRNNDGCVLAISVDAVCQMRSIPVVPNVVDKSKCSRDVKADGIDERAVGQVRERANHRLRLDLLAERCEGLRRLLLKHAKCGLGKAPAFYLAQAKTA